MKGLLEAAARLHAAALEPGAWAPALDYVVSLFGADHAILLAPGDEPTTPFAVSARLCEDHHALFLSPLSAELFVPYQRAIPPGLACPRQRICPDEVFIRSAVYNEILRPADGFHSVNFSQGGPHGFALSICRGRRWSAFGKTETARLQSLLPHISTAMEFRRRLRTAEHRGASLGQLLDRLGDGVMLTDGRARPSYVNGKAASLLAAEDGLCMTADGLAGSSPITTRALRAAIATVNMEDGSRRLSLRRPGRMPLLLTLMPVSLLGASIPGGPPSTVAIFITEPDAPAVIDRTALADAFGLTRRECDVTVLLARGLSTEDIADTLDLSVGAVRQYLKRVFDKTGRRSQAALVALARGFTAPYQ